MEYAWLNASLETGIDNPLDAAIVAAGTAAGASLQDYRKIDEIPYDFIRKRLTIVVARGSDTDDHLIITKGAFSNMLAICSTLRRGDSDLPLDEAMRAKLEDYFHAQGDLGCRVLALATRRIAPRPRYTHDDEADMTFCGFLLFQDPPKATAHRTIADLAALGIRIKIVTGDNRHVAAHVAAGIGLESKAMLTGEQIAQLVDEALWQQAEVTDLFVEVDPQQKERIVRALQAMGHAVGYLGDGVNDAPALRAADVGISVDKAVDVARASADVILLEPDLDVLRKGVEDGRRTFANTLKYIGITTSANFGNMVSMALATPLLPFLPLAAKQILFNNFLSDLPSVFISTDNVDAARIRKAQRWRIADVRRFMLVFGLLSTVFDLATFGLLLRVFHASETVFQTTWFVVSLLTELAVVLVLRTEGPMHRSRPSPMLWWSTLVIAIVALILPYVGPIAVPLGFVPLPLPIATAGLAVVAAYIASTELAKRWYYRHVTA
jgi:Mg2+-importing ATPase